MFQISKQVLRTFSTKKTPFLLREKMNVLAPKLQDYFKKWKKINSGKLLNKDITVEQALGMKGIKCIITETSLLDPYQGVKFRGKTIDQLIKKMPKTNEIPPKFQNIQYQPLPEGMLWLLLTGKMPSVNEVESITNELLARKDISEYTIKQIDSYPKEMHPMIQLSSAVLTLSPGSKFRKAYFDRINKKDLWKSMFDDIIDLIAKIPTIAARIYRNIYFDGKIIENPTAPDWASNFARSLGYDSFEVDELMRLYLTIHSDHEGGNVSSHTCRLVGSALSDPFLSFSASINGLAGPLHGLANQEVLEWVKEALEKLNGKEITVDRLSKYIWDTLKAGRVVPGYGHAVLRVTDPRYLTQQKFANIYIANDDKLIKIVKMLYEIVPGILIELGKVKNPYPNVDAHSGVLLNHFGITQSQFYTVFFAVSRSIGVLSNLLIDRIYGLPIERPKSVTTEWITENLK